MQAWTPNTGLILLFTTLLFAQCKHKGLPVGDPDNGGLQLADGFEAVVVADSLGRARHMAVNHNGDIYVKLRNVDAQGGSVALRDTDGDGKADIMEKFGGYSDSGSYGTAMRIHNGYLYFSTSGEVYRQKLTPGKLVPQTTIEPIVVDDYRNDPHGYEHIAKPIAFDNKGHLYVPFGSPGDACQELKRVPGSKGISPCPELGEHGGVWQFDEAKPNQTIKDGKRYATGIRSIVAMSWNAQDNNLFALQHGRDNLLGTWPQLFNAWQSAVLPSEEFFRVKQGIDAGWPYYYYDWMDKKKKLNPEYGGDGKITAKGQDYEQPIMGFPGHWAPNDLLFYTGNQFPERYRNGAFIAFHGSTIRAPYPQGGYFVAFVPFKNGQPSGEWEVFADGFAGVDTIYNTSDAKARPMGLAQGPDGSLYITESVKGKLWRIVYKGDRNKFSTAGLEKMTALKSTKSNIKHPDAVKDNLQNGMMVGGGHVYTTYCAACHQYNGKGDGTRFPPLANSDWVNGDKQKLIHVLLKGLNQPIQVNGVAYNDVMPAHNFLKDDEISAVLSYVRRAFNNNMDSITPAEVSQARSGIMLASRKKP
ncbi:Glucose/arabinose dehydrogenase, beta-propeller fold [Cnuella takakiae]|uniref:Glucose/arabinose dehydrogenase, beta-propeller fold n=1 Tax=Cnuella takakiae TaxID=1302690 RepID=A0A1M5BX15_9BACT|nr:c-type cytochrome [Cnuella takakiae]OLY93538.1 cytochrome C [Cnuella takakiae]SHF46772.1 Glucose/arabinose dehydrogenase, beta-propeller fold [Cnuella takakiae]